METGLDNNRMIRIISGLKAGETVMLAPPVKEDKSESSEKSEQANGQNQNENGRVPNGKQAKAANAPNGGQVKGKKAERNGGRDRR